MYNLSQADFRHNFCTLKTPQNIYPSWRKIRTESHFSKPNFDMQGPSCCKSYNVYGDPQIFNFLLVQKNIYSLSSLCSRSLTSAQAEIWFFNSSDSGCRTKGPMPNLGRLTVSREVNLTYEAKFQVFVSFYMISWYRYIFQRELTISLPCLNRICYIKEF